MASTSFNSLLTSFDRAESPAILIKEPLSSLFLTREKGIVLYLSLEEENNFK